jgi:hypothetical protein
MKQKVNLFGLIVIILFMTVQCKSPRTYPGELDKLVPGATLIFKGKVLILHTNTTDEVDVSNAGVVEVTEVIDAPESLKDINGQQITMRFADIRKLSAGEERLFFTNPYRFGESISVKEIGSVIKTDELFTSKDIKDYIRQARITQENILLKVKLSQSTLVLYGHVVKVAEPEGNTFNGSEHDPVWKIAEILVDQAIKGKTETKTIRILFASSNDVMYVRSPKFNIGDEGVFIVEQADKFLSKMLRNDKMLIDPANFLKGKEQAERVKSLLK